MKKIEFYRHNIGREEIKELTKVLKSIFLTTGPVTKRFEEELSRYMGIKRVLGVTSATAGLFLILKALDIKEGDEVITSPFSFVATANSILYCGAKPVFVDADPETGNIDLNLIEKAVTPGTKAILPVHLYGVMVDMKKLSSLAEKHNLKIVEDSAHCIEGETDGIKAGQLSSGAAFSFYATKNITSGEGGAVGLNDEALADRIKVLRLHGMSADAADRYTKKFIQYDVPVVGYKYNMFDIQAALLLNQLKLIDKRWKIKKRLYDYYCQKLAGIEEVKVPKIPARVKHSLHLFTVRVPPAKRDEILWKLQQKGIGVAVNYKPIHLFSYYQKTFGYRQGMFPAAEQIGKSTITLPFYSRLKKKEIDHIVRSLKDALL
ncbi:MAG: DegT/DnrJ/EryC1/StrS aminotransferase family protein [bacterium]|nr:DegT/DnrJ/EryC1/StrS aminotransferase family protein [bacterium]